jgi:hypothetical protein
MLDNILIVIYIKRVNKNKATATPEKSSRLPVIQKRTSPSWHTHNTQSSICFVKVEAIAK